MADDERARLAQNLRERREERGLTQQELAELSGVPRPTLAHLESGAGNPTLSVLIKVAEALGVGIEALVMARKKQVRVLSRADLPSEEREGAELRGLGSAVGAGFERWQLGRGGRLERGPARTHERRLLVCESGEIAISAGSELYRLRPGDVAIVESGARPRYENRGRGVAVVYTLLG